MVSHVKMIFILENDFDNSTVTVIINPGETTATVSIRLIDDDLLESTELFNVHIEIGANDTDYIVVSPPGFSQVQIVNEDCKLYLHTYVVLYFLMFTTFRLLGVYHVANLIVDVTTKFTHTTHAHNTDKSACLIWMIPTWPLPHSHSNSLILLCKILIHTYVCSVLGMYNNLLAYPPH